MLWLAAGACDKVGIWLSGFKSPLSCLIGHSAGRDESRGSEEVVVAAEEV